MKLLESIDSSRFFDQAGHRSVFNPHKMASFLQDYLQPLVMIDMKGKGLYRFEAGSWKILSRHYIMSLVVKILKDKTTINYANEVVDILGLLAYSRCKSIDDFRSSQDVPGATDESEKLNMQPRPGDPNPEIHPEKAET